jgi:cytochrome c-type biogenesis protein
VSGLWLASLSAFWFGILTSVSPCPLATNITAITFVSRKTGSPGGVLLSGLLYTLGRASVYVIIAALLVRSLLSAPAVSLTLQTWMNKLLGPILIVVGLVMLGWIRVRLGGGGVGERMQKRIEGWGLAGALLLGVLFALSFCPVSAALYFGSLLPLAVAHASGFMLPLLYGVGTAVPVVLFAVLLAFGARRLGEAFRRVTQLERWMRVATGAVFIGVGLYMSLRYVHELF